MRLPTCCNPGLDWRPFSWRWRASFWLIRCRLARSGFRLERGAKNMRHKAVEELGEELRALCGNSGANPQAIAQLEKMIEEIEGVQRGAFLPFFRQPWVEAILALAGGAGGLAWFGNLHGLP